MKKSKKKWLVNLLFVVIFALLLILKVKADSGFDVDYGGGGSGGGDAGGIIDKKSYCVYNSSNCNYNIGNLLQ